MGYGTGESGCLGPSPGSPGGFPKWELLHPRGRYGAKHFVPQSGPVARRVGHRGFAFPSLPPPCAGRPRAIVPYEAGGRRGATPPP